MKTEMNTCKIKVKWGGGETWNLDNGSGIFILFDLDIKKKCGLKKGI